MDATAFENLDLACAGVGKAIAEKPSKDLEKLVTDSLAVLEEQGLYASFLYLDKGASGREKKELAKGVIQNLNKFLKETPQQSPLFSATPDLFPALQALAEDFDKLLLARDLVRQTLVYARYHTRVQEENEVRT